MVSMGLPTNHSVDALNNTSPSNRKKDGDKGGMGDKGEKGDRKASTFSMGGAKPEYLRKQRVSIADNSIASYLNDRRMSNVSNIGSSMAGLQGTASVADRGVFAGQNGARGKDKADDDSDEVSSASPSVSQLSKWPQEGQDP